MHKNESMYKNILCRIVKKGLYEKWSLGRDLIEMGEEAIGCPGGKSLTKEDQQAQSSWGALIPVYLRSSENSVLEMSEHGGK